MDTQEHGHTVGDIEQSKEPANHLMEMLSLMGIRSSVKTEKMEDAMTCYRIQCSNADARLLIGRRGQTLEALQYILRRLCNTGMQDEEHFIVDVLNYRGDRRQGMLEKVKTGAIAILNGELEYFDLPPMPAFDRRVVHNYLHENFPDLASHSVGIGRDRHIVLTFAGTPKENN